MLSPQLSQLQCLDSFISWNFCKNIFSTLHSVKYTYTFWHVGFSYSVLALYKINGNIHVHNAKPRENEGKNRKTKIKANKLTINE